MNTNNLSYLFTNASYLLAKAINLCFKNCAECSLQSIIHFKNMKHADYKYNAYVIPVNNT